MILDSLFVINAGAAVALLPRRAKGRQSVRRGPESIRHAHQTRTEHSPEDAYRQNLRRFVTKTKSRHGKRMDNATDMKLGHKVGHRTRAGLNGTQQSSPTKHTSPALLTRSKNRALEIVVVQIEAIADIYRGCSAGNKTNLKFNPLSKIIYRCLRTTSIDILQLPDSLYLFCFQTYLNRAKKAKQRS